MAYEADKVVVSLVADVNGFNKDVKDSSAQFQTSMKGIEQSAGGAEKAHTKLTASVGNSRIAMLEFGHIARSTSGQIAAGAPLTQVLAQHMGQLGQAVTFAGGSFGKVGAFLGGSWGLALTVAAAGIGTLIARHKDHAETLDDVFAKLKKHKEQAELNAHAEDIWAHSIDGLIDREKKLGDQLDRRLATQLELERHTLAQAQFDQAAAQNAVSQLPGDPKAQTALTEANRRLHAAQLLASARQAEAMTSAVLAAKDYADELDIIIRKIQTLHPELAERAISDPLRAAVDQVKKAMAEGLVTGLNLNPVRDQVNGLTDALAHGKIQAAEFDQRMVGIAASVREQTAAFKNQDEAIRRFKQSVIGAEGSGPNRMGSSAAGIGQFMPATWLHYFEQAYGKTGQTDAEIIALREKKDIAAGVIDVATSDYVKVLQRAGQQITQAALYTMHLLSAGDPQGRVALRLLNAPAGESTAGFLSAGVLRGNPFLRGTAGGARAAIASRIGDSSAAVSSGALAVQREITEEHDKLEKIIADELSTEQEVTVAKEEQVGFIEQYNAQHRQSLEMMLETLVNMDEWNRKYEEIIASQEELNRFGGEMIDDILNPDNWKDWGEAGKRVLHEVALEILRLGAINPLKNLLFGSSLPTLSSGLAGLFGGGLGQSRFPVVGGVDPLAPLPARARGGPVSAGQSVIVGENGPEVFTAAMSGMVIPNDRAFAAGGGGGGDSVRIEVVPGEYFDVRVKRVAAPMVAEGSIRAAQGGASIARQGLAKTAMHSLER